MLFTDIPGLMRLLSPILLFAVIGCSFVNKKVKNQRDEFSRVLMSHKDVREGSIFPFVKLRNQPYRIYKKFDNIKGKYKQTCKKKYNSFKGQFYRIRYKSEDGLFVEAAIGLPKDFDKNKKYPAMIFNHGNWEEGRRFTYCFTQPYEMWMSKGFVVFGPQYRGVSGGEGIDEWGGSDLLDVLKIVDIARDYSFIDSNNIFMHGNSRGGMMTYLAIKNGANINAAVVNCGVADVFETSKQDDILKYILPASLDEKNRNLEYKNRSAIYWPEKLNVPLLIVHGGQDKGVPVSSIEKLTQMLKVRGKPHKTIIYPKAGHCGENYPREYKSLVYEWIDKHMKN